MVSVRPVPVSVGLLLAFPGPPRPFLEDIPKKEEATKSYTFRFDDRRSLKNTDEVKSSLPARYREQLRDQGDSTKRRPKLPGLKREELDVTWKKRSVEKMEERERIRVTRDEDSRNKRRLLEEIRRTRN